MAGAANLRAGRGHAKGLRVALAGRRPPAPSPRGRMRAPLAGRRRLLRVRAVPRPCRDPRRLLGSATALQRPQGKRNASQMFGAFTRPLCDAIREALPGAGVAVPR